VLSVDAFSKNSVTIVRSEAIQLLASIRGRNCSADARGVPYLIAVLLARGWR
jgi:hypothetical protein